MAPQSPIVSTVGVTSETLYTGGLLDARYVVPDYQRDYRWQSEQINVFWADLLPVIHGTRKELYLGTFYCELIRDDAEEKKQNGETLDGNELKHFGLIDGQQRLTTVQLLLAVLEDELTYLETLVDPKDKTTWSKLNKKVAQLLYCEEGGSDTLRLQSNHEGEFAKQLLLDNRNYVDRRQFAEDYVKSFKPEFERYAKCYTTLLANFEQLVDVEEPGDRLGWVEKVYNAINQVLFVRLKVAELPVHELFESVNDRGLGLDNSELVKNYLFAEASKKGELERVKVAWGAACAGFRGDSGLKFLDVLHYFVILKQDVGAKEKQLKGDCKECIDRLGPAKFCIELQKFAERIVMFHKHKLPTSPGNAIDEIGYGLRTLMKKFSFLVVGSTYLAPVSDARVVHICRLVEMHTFRFMHVHDVSRKKDKFANFCRLTAREIHDHLSKPKVDWDLENLLEQVEEKMLSALEDTEFEEDFVEFYENDGPVQEYILRKLEIAASNGTQSPTARGKTQHIEHIYPKNPHSGYSKKYDPGKDIDWSHMSEFHDPAKISASDRKKIYNRIGNLVLLEAVINNKIKNKGIDFKISNSESTDPKKPSCYSKSEYKLAKKIFKYASSDGSKSGRMEWNKSTIEARQKELAKEARKAWKVSKTVP